MGRMCVLFKLLNNLKQPFKCIVNYGCYSLQTGVIFLALGVALVYFFVQYIETGNPLQRGLAFTGIISVVAGLLLLKAAITIMVFYSRLYDSHQQNLQDIAEEKYCKKIAPNFSDVNDTTNVATVEDKNMSTIKSDVSVTTALDAQQNIFPYNPNLAMLPTAPPPLTIEPMDGMVQPATVPQWTMAMPPIDPGAGPSRP